MENAVTHAVYRKKGYAADCLNYAKHIAEESNCYKMMLLTGSKEESILISIEIPDITVQIKQHLYSG